MEQKDLLDMAIPYVESLVEKCKDIINDPSVEKARSDLEQLRAVRLSLESQASGLPPMTEENVTQALVDVRDLLAKGWKDEALNFVEDLLANHPTLGRRMEQVAHVKSFEDSFATACRKHNVIAGFVVLEKVLDTEGKRRMVKMITGGHQLADAVIAYHLRGLQASLGVDPNPMKSYMNIGEIVRRAPTMKEE